MKSSNSNIDQRKLMDKLSSPPHFGPLIGLLATTYEMQPEFFETDFLPAVLNLGAWDDRSWTSRIEIEKKLAHMESATVFLDALRYRNRPRSLRVKIVPVFLGQGRAQHSKVVLLVYENVVRLIVGSANLTQPGYRENREVATVLTANEKNREQALLISSALLHIPKILNTWWNPECEQLVKRAMDLLAAWGVPSRQENEWFVWGGGEKPVWKSFVSRWPESDRIQRITIVSPFWSDDPKQMALVTLIDMLKDREALVDGTEVRLLTEAAPDTQTTYKPSLPPSFGDFDFSSLGIVASAQAVGPQVLREEVGVEGFNRNRHLHAKIVLFEGNNTSLAYLGSANFTRKGWGFLEDSVGANIEAGIVVRRAGRARSAMSALIPETSGPIIELTGDGTARLAPSEPEPEAVPWPDFVKEILLAPSPEDVDRLELLIAVEQERIKGDWALYIAEKESDGGEKVIFDSSSNPHHLESYRVYLEEEWLNTLLREQEVIVQWWGFDEVQSFPINVALEARHTLPVTPGNHKFSEQHLILYYQGRITWEELFPDPEKLVQPGDNMGILNDDFGRGVDTSKIQAYQVREFVEALKGIVDDLKVACRNTEPAMRLALLGPVSPLALARVLTDAVFSGEKSPVAAGFQLVEIRACIESARMYEPAERYKEVWLGYINKALETVDRLLDKLRKRSPEHFNNRGPFARYERSIRRYYRKAG